MFPNRVLPRTTTTRHMKKCTPFCLLRMPLPSPTDIPSCPCLIFQSTVSFFLFLFLFCYSFSPPSCSAHCKLTPSHSCMHALPQIVACTWCQSRSPCAVPLLQLPVDPDARSSQQFGSNFVRVHSCPLTTWCSCTFIDVAWTLTGYAVCVYAPLQVQRSV